MEDSFDFKKVFIHRDLKIGDVILSNTPNDWSGFIHMLMDTDVPKDFLSRTERAQHSTKRDPFNGWKE